MADVNVSVMVDGKTVFVHGAANAPNPRDAVLMGLQAATLHFQAQHVAETGVKTTGQMRAQEAQNTQGPTL